MEKDDNSVAGVEASPQESTTSDVATDAADSTAVLVRRPSSSPWDVLGQQALPGVCYSCLLLQHVVYLIRSLAFSLALSSCFLSCCARVCWE